MQNKLLDWNTAIGRDTAEANALRIFKYKYDQMLKQKLFYVPETIKGSDYCTQLAWLEQYGAENGIKY